MAANEQRVVKNSNAAAKGLLVNPERRRVLFGLAHGVAALAAVSVLGLPASLSAEPSKTRDPKTLNGAKLAQASPVDGGVAPLPVMPPKRIDTSTLPKVSLEEIQKLERDLWKYKPRTTDHPDSFGTDVAIQTRNTGMYALGSVYHEDVTHTSGRVTPAGTKSLTVFVNGKPIADIDLNPLAQLYTQETGKEMRAVKLIPSIEHGSRGEVFNVLVVPGSEVKENLPAQGISFYVSMPEIKYGQAYL